MSIQNMLAALLCFFLCAISSAGLSQKPSNVKGDGDGDSMIRVAILKSGIGIGAPPADLVRLSVLLSQSGFSPVIMSESNIADLSWPSIHWVMIVDADSLASQSLASIKNYIAAGGDIVIFGPPPANQTTFPLGPEASFLHFARARIRAMLFSSLLVSERCTKSDARQALHHNPQNTRRGNQWGLRGTLDSLGHRDGWHRQFGTRHGRLFVDRAKSESRLEPHRRAPGRSQHANPHPHFSLQSCGSRKTKLS